MIRSSGYRVTNSLRPSLAVGSTDGYAGVAVAVLPPSLRVSSPLETVLQDALGSQYRLERELEAGGMSRLFLATDLRLKREVVVKVLPPDLVSVASTSRFKREIELTVRLQHPHILPVLTSGEFEDGLFYITPYIQGESLRARIERETETAARRHSENSQGRERRARVRASARDRASGHQAGEHFVVRWAGDSGGFRNCAGGVDDGDAVDGQWSCSGDSGVYGAGTADGRESRRLCARGCRLRDVVRRAAVPRDDCEGNCRSAWRAAR